MARKQTQVRADQWRAREEARVERMDRWAHPLAIIWIAVTVAAVILSFAALAVTTCGAGPQ